MDQLEYEIGGVRYLINSFPTTFGLHVMQKLQSLGEETSLAGLEPKVIKEIFIRSVTINNVSFTEDKFDKHFRKKFKEMFEVLGKVIEHNFGSEGESEGEIPNE